ncbi:MAG: XdhC family protein [Pseudomonadota bacterium]
MTPDLLADLNRARKDGRAICLVSSPQYGAEQLVHYDTLQDAPEALQAAANAAFQSDKQQSITLDDVPLYLTPFNPPIEVIIVGAVHIAQALLPLLDALDFKATLVDPRGAFARQERFAAADVLIEWPDEAFEKLTIGHRTAVVALTHDPKLDDPALSSALQGNPFYIGALGSKRTHAKRIERLQAAGFSTESIARISAPIGLDIGASGAAEIALSIAADLVKTLRTPAL